MARKRLEHSAISHAPLSIVDVEVSSFTDLLEAFNFLLSETPKLKELFDNGKAGNLTTTSLAEAENLTNPADIARFAADIVGFFDPTGISGIVSALAYPTCSAISLPKVDGKSWEHS